LKDLLEILPLKYPIIQAGMVWVSGGKLAAASANSGILGVIGAGSMSLEILDQQIKKALSLTTHPERLAVNVPLLYEKSKEQIEIALNNNIQIFITSAGSPKTYTSWLKEQGKTVIHVTSSPVLAKKCEAAGCDAVIAEGFEAGGHNGRDEITTLVLIPQVVEAVKIPVIAAGGIIDGRSMLAALSLGAAGVQMGTRFVAASESSAHENFKSTVINAQSDSTMLMMKKATPVRLFKNKFFEEIKVLEENGASREELNVHLGKGRARLGMHEGDMENGEIEIGQGAALVKKVQTVQEIVTQTIYEYHEGRKALPSF
jgi:enoyl-[acyl-carrier protein] reductase II